MNESTLFIAAVSAVALAFAGFAWMFVSALREGTANYAQTMGEETSRQFADVFMFISPAKIARLGRLAALCPDRVTARVPLIPGYNTEEDCDRSEAALRAMGFSHIDRFRYVTERPSMENR